MISLSVIFWTFIVLFALIGALRGWSKELLVMFSIILALFIIQVVQSYVPLVSRMLASSDARGQFFLWSLAVCFFAFFGYHAPTVNKLASVKLMTPRDRLQDWLLGGILGACNGYLLVGTILYYLDMTGYPFPEAHISPPKQGDAVVKLISLLPPAWLVVPYIYFAVAIAFAIIVIVFI
ncbi:CvpA family protein [Candidatus Electronema sp. JC]|uniref:CvpA family protein n=1 Tax=Candidatus Electronema sp. JC TaxID=3401570 RepID=UPI003B4279BE